MRGGEGQLKHRTIFLPDSSELIFLSEMLRDLKSEASCKAGNWCQISLLYGCELSLGLGGLEGCCVRAPLGGLASELPCCQQAWSCGAGACGRSHGHSRQGPRGEALSLDPFPAASGWGLLDCKRNSADRHPGSSTTLDTYRYSRSQVTDWKPLLLSPALSHCLLSPSAIQWQLWIHGVLLDQVHKVGWSWASIMEQRGARVLVDEEMRPYCWGRETS